MAEKNSDQPRENSIFLSHTDRLAFIDGTILKPEKSQAVFNHSPDGFSWGYGGPGPAQLALAILLVFVDEGEESVAVRLHQHFKAQVIASLDPDLDANIRLDVKAWIKKAKENMLAAQGAGQ